jgi:hypothetical protein
MGWCPISLSYSHLSFYDARCDNFLFGRPRFSHKNYLMLLLFANIFEFFASFWGLLKIKEIARNFFSAHLIRERDCIVFQAGV